MSIQYKSTVLYHYGHQVYIHSKQFQKHFNVEIAQLLNCPEEVYLAEKLIDRKQWSDMAIDNRSGGEANAIAIRIARAASGRDKVAVCGYPVGMIGIII